ncbi:XRE family transcriptional regulator [Candidatus Desulfarcum epimagneticum]|uniref:XRE family transcriptional regulator n=1 Tax=uncultured Desulfobacteraceae bacterium TaxID=218296 RepID=A0A484HE01_9BACT|nr:XRE family transcriptional regulator [uncultured Desulfobacteraceae bacterium]
MPKKKETLVPVGKRIKKIRTEKSISFERLANDTGFSVEYLKRMEKGEETPSVGALLQIARSLEMDSAEFLRSQENRQENRVREYAMRTDNYAYKTLTPGAENKHLKSFLVEVDPMRDHTGLNYQHEGEEFAYLLSGSVEIIVGENVNRLEAGESLHFNSGIRHQLKNVGDEKAELLVVIYSP